jgi:WD40 repeat protein/tRNA A-37 threonylcarbamoyl transferase component Bud32
MKSESPDALESLVGEIADEFTRRHHRGEGPRVEEYADRYPELAALLRDILPAIQALGPDRGGAAETPGAPETPGAGAAVPPPVHLDEYEILGEVGRGGMGVVYKARHRGLGRVVALKVLRSEAAADLARFRREAQAVARLQHPNVVQLFEVREVDGRPLLALEFVAGGTLAERVKGEPQPPRRAAALVRTLARAIAAAHDRGLVHRDLKPSNVLLAEGDNTRDPSSAPAADRALGSLVPKITDFGLAKRLDEDAGQTQTGAIVGTPSYMAPEQAAAGGPVGPAADIHALGAILYELITGRPPFKGPSALETVDLVRHAEPTPPTRLQPGCPRDLETVCLKCLRKDPAARYPTAGALADDLQRFVDGAPIHARPVGAVDRLGKWARRKPAVAASMALGSLAAFAVVALAVRLVYSWELEDANQKLGEAVGAKESALVTADEARRAAEYNHQQADEARAKLDAALGREQALHYIHSINLAYREWQANRVDEARRLLDTCPHDLRHWEWHYLDRQCHAEALTIRGHVGPITALAVSPDGMLIAGASLSRDSVPYAADLKVWDAATGKLAMALDNRTQVTDLAFNPDGTRLASVGYDDRVRIWDLKTAKVLQQIQVGGAVVHRVAFSPDGTRLAALARSQIRLFDADSGSELFTLSGHTAGVRALAFSPDGRRLVSGGADRLVKLWDLATRKEVFSRSGHTGAIDAVAFSPGQDQIISSGAGSGGTARSEIRLWNAVDGTPAPNALTFPFAVGSAAFTASPGQIVCTGDGSIRFLDAGTGGTTFVLHAAPNKLAVTLDGRHVVTDSPDRTIRVWPTRNPEFVEVPLTLPVHAALALSGNGTRVAWSDYNRFATQWGSRWGLRVAPVPPAAKGSVDIRPSRLIVALAYSPDNRRLACADQNGVDLIDLDTSQVSRVIAEFGVWDLCISPDGRYLATATRHPDVSPQGFRGLMRELDLELTKGRATTPHRQPVPAIKVWRVADGSLVHTLAGQMSVAFSPDSRQLAGARGRDVVVWDAATGTERRTLTGPAEPVLKVQFTAAGRWVVGFTRRRATVWHADSGRTVATVDGLDGPASVTPDGRRIVGVFGGISMKWWDVQLGREVLSLPLPGATGLPVSLALSTDGRRVATSSDNRLLLWEAGPP